MRFHAFWPLRDYLMRCHGLWAVRDFMSFPCEIFCCLLHNNDGICREGAIVIGWFPYEISLCDLLLNFRLRFPYEIVCFLLHNFLTRFPLRDFMLSCRYEMSLWNLSRFCCILFSRDFLMRFHALLAVMRCPCDILCFLLHNFRTRYPDEIYAFLGRHDLCVSFHLEKV